MQCAAALETTDQNPRPPIASTSFPVLWDTVVGGGHLADVNPVSGCEKRCEQIEDPRAVFGSQEPFDVLKNEGSGPLLGNHFSQGLHKTVTAIAVPTRAR
jgi:hypothetical protein